MRLFGTNISKLEACLHVYIHQYVPSLPPLATVSMTKHQNYSTPLHTQNTTPFHVTTQGRTRDEVHKFVDLYIYISYYHFIETKE